MRGRAPVWFRDRPEVRDYTYSRVALELTIDAYEGTATKKTLLFEVADAPYDGSVVDGRFGVEHADHRQRRLESARHGQAEYSTLTTIGCVDSAITSTAPAIRSPAERTRVVASRLTVSAWVKCANSASPTLISFGGLRPSVRLQNSGGGRPIIHMARTTTGISLPRPGRP